MIEFILNNWDIYIFITISTTIAYMDNIEPYEVLIGLIVGAAWPITWLATLLTKLKD